MRFTITDSLWSSSEPPVFESSWTTVSPAFPDSTELPDSATAGSTSTASLDSSKSARPLTVGWAILASPHSSLPSTSPDGIFTSCPIWSGAWREWATAGLTVGAFPDSPWPSTTIDGPAINDLTNWASPGPAAHLLSSEVNTGSQPFAVSALGDVLAGVPATLLSASKL